MKVVVVKGMSKGQLSANPWKQLYYNMLMHKPSTYLREVQEELNCVCIYWVMYVSPVD